MQFRTSCSRLMMGVLTSALLLSARQSSGAAVDLPLGQEFGASAGTESKPQSKLWMNDGSWWCVVATPQGNRIHELVEDSWVALDSPDALLGDADARADVLWDGSHLIVLLFGPRSQLFEFSYDATHRRYQRLTGFPVDLPLAASSETAVIDQDSRGRLWITWTAEGQVLVAHSESDQRRWDFPGTVLQEGVNADDISTVVAFGGDAIGVLWSDQERAQFGFRMRQDDMDVSQWNDTEVVFSGEKVADDHLNTCTDSRGRIYVVSKNGRHELSAHMRQPDGTWTTHENVLNDGHGTRPIIMLSEAGATVYMLYTRWHDGLEIIEYRQAPLGTLDFGEARPFIILLGEDVRLTDVTGTKQPLDAETLVALASAQGRTWWNGWGEGISPGKVRTADTDLRLSCFERTPDAFLALAFDEGHGSITADASPAMQRVRLGGVWSHDMSEPVWVEGVSGSALRFDGLRQFVEIDEATSLTPDGSFTVEAWVRRLAVWQNNVVLCKGVPGQRSYQLRIDSANRISFLRDVEGESSKHRVRSRVTLEDSLWHHIACVVDLERQESRLYLDGAKIAAAPDSGITAHTASSLFVGAREYKERLREWWTGDIDQIRLSPGALYSADFTPPTRFPSAGQAVILSWAPAISGPGVPRAYEVLRRLGEEPFEPLTAHPLQCTQQVDVPPAGHVIYRVRAVHSSWPAPEDQQIDWPPAPAPPLPRLQDRSSAPRH